MVLDKVNIIFVVNELSPCDAVALLLLDTILLENCFNMSGSHSALLMFTDLTVALIFCVSLALTKKKTLLGGKILH